MVQNIINKGLHGRLALLTYNIKAFADFFDRKTKVPAFKRADNKDEIAETIDILCDMGERIEEGVVDHIKSIDAVQETIMMWVQVILILVFAMSRRMITQLI